MLTANSKKNWERELKSLSLDSLMDVKDILDEIIQKRRESFDALEYSYTTKRKVLMNELVNKTKEVDHKIEGQAKADLQKVKAHFDHKGPEAKKEDTVYTHVM